MLSVKVTLDLDHLKDRFTEEEIGKKRRLFASHVMEDCDRYVPVDTGQLHDNRLVSEDGRKLEWSEEYAHYVYNMDHVISAGNPNGTPQWFETAKQNHLPEWVEFMEQEVANG